MSQNTTNEKSSLMFDLLLCMLYCSGFFFMAKLFFTGENLDRNLLSNEDSSIITLSLMSFLLPVTITFLSKAVDKLKDTLSQNKEKEVDDKKEKNSTED